MIVGKFPAWQPAQRCSGSAQPGTRALAAWILEEYAKKGAFNLGIYNCRSVRGASTTSMHGEGRAFDAGFPVGDPDGDELLRRLLKRVGRLGIQAIIYERRIYSAKSPQGRPYTGLVPHTDHLHIEQTRHASEVLTLASIRRIMAGTVPVVHAPGSRTLRVGCRGADVKFLQRRLHVQDDGVYGHDTKAAVTKYERSKKKQFPKLVVDGVVGKLTWHTLGVKVTY